MSMIDDFELLTVKYSAAADEARATVNLAIRNTNTREVVTRAIAPDEKNYDAVNAMIADLQSGKLSQSEFSDKVLELVLASDIVGVQHRVQNSTAISAHVSVADNRVYVDGHEINSVLEQEILNLMLDDPCNDDSNFQALVHFVEKLYNNTSDYVRDQLYGWIDYQINHGTLTITPDGNLITYKGGNLKTVDGVPTVMSIHAGHGFINGKEFKNDYLPNCVGDIIEIPRTEVDDDPHAACSIGLHVGTWDYAKGFSQGAVMTVEVDPADVVSVPADYNNQKVRVCRYKVIDIVKDQLNELVFGANYTPDETREPVPDDFEIPEDFDGSEYHTLSGETRMYADPTIEEVNYDNILILTEDDEYRTLLKSGVTFIRGGVYIKPREDDFEIPDDFDGIDYMTIAGDHRYYRNPEIENENDDSILITTEDGEYRWLRKSGVTFDNYEPDDYDDYSEPDDDDADAGVPNFTDIKYVTQTGESRSYHLPSVLETPADNYTDTYLIKTEDGKYKRLDASRVEFLDL